MIAVAALTILAILAGQTVFRAWCLHRAVVCGQDARGDLERPINLWQRNRAIAPPITMISMMDAGQPDCEARIRRLIGLSYPNLSTIIAVPRSDRALVRKLARTFHLRPVAGRLAAEARAGAPAVLGGGTGALRVLAVDAGGQSDALNACLAEAQTPYICIVSGRATPPADAMMRAMEALVSGDSRIVAVGGVAEGDPGASGRRALIDRLALASLGLLAPTGAPFAILRREAVFAAGGLSGGDGAIGINTLAKIHRASPGTMVAVAPEAKCRIEQHQRAGRNAEVRRMLWRNLGAVGRLRYGRFGMITLPLLWLETVLAPAAEIAALGMFGLLAWQGGPALAFAIAALSLAIAPRLATQLVGLRLQVANGELPPSLAAIARAIAADIRAFASVDRARGTAPAP